MPCLPSRETRFLPGDVANYYGKLWRPKANQLVDAPVTASAARENRR